MLYEIKFGEGGAGHLCLFCEDACGLVVDQATRLPVRVHQNQRLGLLRRAHFLLSAEWDAVTLTVFLKTSSKSTLNISIIKGTKISLLSLL